MGTGTEIGRVRGLGSAKAGAHHWWIQRLTAGSNLLLMLWFIFSLLRLPHYDHASVTTWLSTPLAAVPMMLLIASVFWHFRLGLQVVIEDYQHDETRVIALVLLNFYSVAMAAFAIFAVLKIAFTGGAA
jgi:succinate dehydrogenase / fumarate reductase membrane anchor subunit